MLSMVHGDVIEEREVLAIEQERSPEFFEIYLADGPIDRDELDWLHDRRLADIELADTILVPSAHIARRLVDVHGLAPTRVHILPYAADIERFRPAADKRHDPNRCVFLFAGGITARKGIHDLLDAWLRIKRGGWKLQLLGPLPANTRPLEPYLAHVELLGRIGHADMCCHMANADVFVFPSLFEGSAVVTYEALACGLPSVVTAESGAVVRDSIEGFLVPARDPETLAIRMETIGRDPQLRSQMARNARARALQFGWRRYSASLLEILSTGKGASSISPSSVGQGTRTDHNPKSQYEECSV
jgi:glycosyltransferase involved in cell wall biosynthesis